MSKTSKELREEMKSLHERAKTITDKAFAENRKMTAEEEAEYKKVNEDFDLKDEQRKLIESEESRSAIFTSAGNDRLPRQDFDSRDSRKTEDREERREKRRQAPTLEDRAIALQGWCRRQMGKGVKQKHIDAAERCGINIRRSEIGLPLHTGSYAQMRDEANRQVREGRAMSAVNLSAGGGFVPEGFMNRLETALLAYGGMRQVADVMRTSGGNPIPWPTVDDTSNEGEQINENTSVGTQDIAVKQVTFNAYKFSSKLITVPVELMEDSAFNLVEFLGNAIGMRLGRATNRAFTTGNGGTGPTGIAKIATSFSAASSSAIAFDDVFGLIHAVDPLYRANGTLMMHDSIVLALRKLKDSQNRYLWEVSPGNVDPSRLAGYPYVVNQHMDSTFSSGKQTVIFGDLSKYKIREVGTIRLRRLVERYAEKDQEGFVGFLRCDGNLLDAGTHPVKVLTH